MSDIKNNLDRVGFVKVEGRSADGTIRFCREAMDKAYIRLLQQEV